MAKRIDFIQLRKDRQGYNNKLIIDSVLEDNQEKFYKSINNEEYKRSLKDLNMTHSEFWKKCKNDIFFLKISARLLSKNASRQGTIDEKIQIEICNEIALKYDSNITILNKTAYRPTKKGIIISHKTMKKDKISKDQCLKSFDAKITGKITGWLSAKITFGNGGHQDNVFEEEDNLCLWWKKYMKDKEERLVILIDTNLEKEFEILKNKYQKCKNIIITDHVGLQEFIINLMKVNNCKS